MEIDLVNTSILIPHSVFSIHYNKSANIIKLTH